MIKKSIYEAPETELILVRFEEIILGNPSDPVTGGGGSYGDDDTNDNGPDY